MQSALDQGIPVVAYDRLIENPGALYVTFDNVEIGRLEAEAVQAQVPKGNYVFIKGNSADANADFLRSGQQEVLQDALDSGDIKNVGESYTDNWDPAIAQTNMEQFLTDNNNKVDAVLAENDGMAGGVVAAFEAQGLAGSGRGVRSGRRPAAGLNRVALGTQTVDVWKDARDLGKAAGEAACRDGAGHGARGRRQHAAVRLAGRERDDLDPPDPPGDHAGQPQRRARRGLDLAGGPVPGRRAGHGGCVRLANEA